MKRASEEISSNNTFNESTLKYFFLISIRSEQKSKNEYAPVKGAHHSRHKKVAPLPSTRTNELHASDQYANERELSLLVWLNNEMEVGQSILVNFVSLILGLYIPVTLPELKNIVQTRF